MRKIHPDARRYQQGIALIAVLWIVAALSIIVTGVVHSVRSEVRLINHTRQAVEGGALEHAAQTLGVGHVPAGDIARKRLHLKDAAKVGHGRDIDVVQVARVAMSGYLLLNDGLQFFARRGTQGCSWHWHGSTIVAWVSRWAFEVRKRERLNRRLCPILEPHALHEASPVVNIAPESFDNRSMLGVKILQFGPQRHVANVRDAPMKNRWVLVNRQLFGAEHGQNVGLQAHCPRRDVTK